MYLDNGKIKLSLNSEENTLYDEVNDINYIIDFFEDNGKYVQGGNGLIFSLKNENADYVIKFCKFKESLRGDEIYGKRIQRFDREIEALYKAIENDIPNVVKIIFDGYYPIGGEEFGYYVMERCDCNLKKYLLKNELGIYQKMLLCKKILEGIKSLNDSDIYHRDIKHDNIFIIDNEPIIGDLGLADFRKSDIYINERGELIGPTGWFSPEAINKFLIEKTPNPYNLDFNINSKSEIFQLGKLFWYILQGNLPIGQITIDDFIPGDNEIFNIIYNMLLYSKNNRWDCDNVNEALDIYLQSN